MIGLAPVRTREVRRLPTEQGQSDSLLLPISISLFPR
jgi:hypothetical protein